MNCARGFWPARTSSSGRSSFTLSTAPTWQDRRLAPRHLMVRLYAVATGGGDYVVMPGGLTRAGNSSESIILSTQTGGGSKDTWVLADGTPDTTTLLPTSTRSSALSRAGFILSSRLADNLFWLGRYVERIEFGCRMARCLLHRMTDESEQGRLGRPVVSAGRLRRPRPAAAARPAGLACGLGGRAA